MKTKINMPKIACNIAPALASRPATFEELVSAEQKPIDKAPTLAELAAELYPLFGEKD